MVLASHLFAVFLFNFGAAAEPGLRGSSKVASQAPQPQNTTTNTSSSPQRQHSLGLTQVGQEGVSESWPTPGFPGPIRWKNHPWKCLDVADGHVKNGARLQIWDCHAGAVNQQFLLLGKTIRWAAHPEYCVDIHDHGNFNGNKVQLWKCSPWNTDQHFEVPETGAGPLRWSNHPHMCLDVRDHQTANGAAMQIWSCDERNTDQNFLVWQTPVPVPTPSPTTTKAYDIIIVGGGLVGSAVAAGLAERLPNKRVLLVEAGAASQRDVGGRDPPASYEHGHWQEWPGFKSSGLTRYDVPGNYEALQCWSNDCETSWKKTVPAFQCRILGGCGVMNGALMQIPAAEMFESWPAGWQWKDLAQYFKAAEHMYTITATPSRDGHHYLDSAGADFVRRVMSSHGFQLVDSLEKKAGTMARPHVSARDGVRESTASLLLPEALKRPNFELRLNTEVLSIANVGGTAKSLRVQNADKTEEVLAVAEGGMVVVSAGAMNTPRLLLASGLNGGGHVGHGLSDHTLKSMVYKLDGLNHEGASRGFHITPHPDNNSTSSYIRVRSGPLTQFGPTLTFFIRDPSTKGGPDVFDVEAWVNPVGNAGEVHLSAVLMRPTCSYGSVYYHSGQLHMAGNLELSCARDHGILSYAVNQIDRWLGAFGARQVVEKPPAAMNHFVGSCALGPCADAASLRLSGTVNIAVADASLVPSQVWGHPAMTLTALALKATDMLASWF